ncbi:MAG: hypothetical protein ACLQVI_28795 [Polyangiaceae bacterium]|jgi:hypothetical protein
MTKSLRALVSLAFTVCGIVSLASACNGSVSGYEYGGWRGDPCGQYASCGTCTPVMGCGWCTTGVNQGMCASDPNECAGAAAFSWTWNASGCFAPADAGVVEPVDAGTPSPVDAAPVGNPISSFDARVPGTPDDAEVPDDASHTPIDAAGQN